MTVDTAKREALHEAIDATLEAMEELTRLLHQAGARDSDNQSIRSFCAYHLADLEGNDGGAGWLAGRLLADEMRSLQIALDDPEWDPEEEDR